jgi:deoxyadenosine/deoxycytidine kinase
VCAVVTTVSLQANILIMLEGVSGAGKSTLSSIVAKHLHDVCIIPEPFDRWQNINNKGNLFETFLNDKSRWGLTFQYYVFLTHLQTIQDAYQHNSTKTIFICDRSHYSGIYIFAKMFFDTGLLTPLEYAAYQETTDWYIRHIPGSLPAGFIYLQTKPETACARANKRNRSLNHSLDVSHFQTLHTYHEQWLMQKKEVSASIADIPILVIDGEVDFVENQAEQDKIVKQIEDFVQQLQRKRMS